MFNSSVLYLSNTYVINDGIMNLIIYSSMLYRSDAYEKSDGNYNIMIYGQQLIAISFTFLS